VVGAPDDVLWQLAGETALGGVHPIRHAIIEFLVRVDDSHMASMIAARARLKETTVRRHLDDLVALGVLDLVKTRPDEWAASKWLLEGWTALTPLSEWEGRPVQSRYLL